MYCVSKTIGVEVELDECEGGIKLIRHETIESILHENEKKLKVDCVLKCCNPQMVVVECTATLLDTGKTFFKVGEANPSNLEGEISKKYPATMAYNRAIDRAVIAALGLPQKKVYSSEEIQNAKKIKNHTEEQTDFSFNNLPPFENLPFEEPDNIQPPEDSNSKKNTASQENEKAESIVSEMEDATVPMQEVISLFDEPDDNVADKTEKNESISPENNKKVENTNDNQNDEFMNYDEIILFGRFRGKKYGDVKNDKQFLAFVNWVDVNNPQFDNEAAMKQAELFKKINRKIKSNNAA